MMDGLEKFYGGLDEQYARGDLAEVERFLLESAERAQKDRQAGRSELIAVYNELGSFYRGVSRYAQSLAAFERARSLAANDLGKGCSQYATVLNNMAGTYRLTGDHEHAIELFLEAIAIYRREGQEQSYAYVGVLNNLALVYREAGRYGEATEYLEQSLALIEKMPDHGQEVAVTYNNLAALYHAAGDKARAMACLDRALREFEACGDAENTHYAAGLSSMAGLLFAEGEYERALELYRKSAKYTLRFFGENIEYGITCQNLCWVYTKLGRQKEAIGVLTQAQRVYERLLGAGHERTRAVACDLRQLRQAARA